MSIVVYPARASGDPEAGYRAVFPDFPGREVAAHSLAELQAQARESVRSQLQAMADQGLDWPRATPIEQIAAEAGAFLLLVDVQVDDTPVRINISIGEQLLKRLDAAAEARGASRSGFIAQAVRASLGERRHGEAGAPDFEAAARRLQDELSAFGRRITDMLGPNSAFSRSLAEVDDRVSETVRKAADSVSAAMSRRREAETRRAGGDKAAARPEDTAAI